MLELRSLLSSDGKFSMTPTLYGIKNCDTVKKARRWLEDSGIEYQYHDFREHGLDKQQLATWLSGVGIEKLVNRRSTTWKQLDETDRESINDGRGNGLILGNPTLIKRPVLEANGNVYCGFSEDEYQEIFKG